MLCYLQNLQPFTRLSATVMTIDNLKRFFRRRVRGKRRHHRYAVIDEDDDKLESMEMLPKGSLCAYVNFSGNTVFCLMGLL